MPRSVVKTVLIGDDADVGQVAKENQRAKLVIFFRRRRFKARPQRACAAPLEIYSAEVELYSTQNQNNRKRLGPVEPQW